MFDRPVLGVDPGVATVGLAVLSGREVAWSETLRTSAGLEEAARLRRVYETVAAALRAHRPAALAIERLMWGKNVGSAMGVARASGVILLAAADAGVPVAEYAPLEVKMATAGVGNAGKDQVRSALGRFHKIIGVPEQPDAADAVAIAFCHQTQAGLQGRVKAAVR